MVERISPQTLREWLDSPQPPTVVDVRDDGYIGGHIKGCMHVPSAVFAAKVDDLRRQLDGKDRIVFHCQYSQQRGPSCARYFASDPATPKTYVLSGGFSNWAHTFNGEEGHTEAYRPELYAFF